MKRCDPLLRDAGTFNRLADPHTADRREKTTEECTFVIFRGARGTGNVGFSAVSLFCMLSSYNAVQSHQAP
jgi:hypothetical protein